MHKNRIRESVRDIVQNKLSLKIERKGKKQPFNRAAIYPWALEIDLTFFSAFLPFDEMFNRDQTVIRIIIFSPREELMMI